MMIRHRVIFLCFLLTLSPATAGYCSRDGEPDGLAAERKALTEQVEALRRERDFLLFQKTAAAADSKYLVLSLKAGKGQLLYKNRILRDFRFLAVQDSAGRLKQGTVVLTAKTESSRGARTLVFGNERLLFRTGVRPVSSGVVPVLSLGKRDLAALFYALEKGAQAYILP